MFAGMSLVQVTLFLLEIRAEMANLQESCNEAADIRAFGIPDMRKSLRDMISYLKPMK